MKLALSILLINLILIRSHQYFKDDDDFSDLMMKDKKMEKFIKNLKKFKKFFRILHDTSESESEDDESNESNEFSESNEQSEFSESEEPSESSESEEPSESNESKEPSESSESEEPSESSESEESSESSESEEPSESSESEEPSESSESEEPSESSELTDITIETPIDGNITIDPLERYPAPIGNRKSYFHLLRFSGFRQPRPSLITFFIFVEFHLVRPAYRIVFTVKIIYSSLRDLQNYEDNCTAYCNFLEADDENQNTKYSCQIYPKNNIKTVSSNNVFYLDGKKLDYGEMNFSPGASKATFNLQNEVVDIDRVATLNNGDVFNNYTKSFSIKGKFQDLGVEKINCTFYDVYTKERDGVDVLCDVINKDENNYQLQCTPPAQTNLTGYIYQSNCTIGNLHLNLNMSKYNDYVDVYYSSPSPITDNNVHFRVNSSGLSGGAIAAIVIGISIVLCGVTIIIILLKKPKKKKEEDSSIIGLRTIDNF